MRLAERPVELLFPSNRVAIFGVIVTLVILGLIFVTLFPGMFELR